MVPRGLRGDSRYGPHDAERRECLRKEVRKVPSGGLRHPISLLIYARTQEIQAGKATPIRRAAVRESGASWEGIEGPPETP